MADADLQDLVDNPIERLHVELKSWLDLKDKIVRANVARHICALSNHGGGYIVFGFSNDRTPDTVLPDVSRYTTDEFSGIAKRYLSPAPQCIAHEVISAGGQVHVVLWIPSHGPTPVCAVGSGPHDKAGAPQGIAAGVHYHRATGP